ncbi:MAG: M56 family metallopeptidase [Coriobacteriales bacterium]|nr:M56 family metallopeptidase [Coriobacteriales bacterium]
MDKLLLTVVNMSLTGSFVILVICLARLPLKRLPKSISYCLWIVAAFRLVCPFTFDSIFSLIPFSAQAIPVDIARQSDLYLNRQAPTTGDIANTGLLQNDTLQAVNTASSSPLLTGTTLLAIIWLAVVISLLIHSVVSYFLLLKKLQNAQQVEGILYQVEKIRSLFILGVFSPRIYIPAGLTEQEREYVVLHEQTHLRRRDHIVKSFAHVVLCLHWFNPLVWLAFRLMSTDMEMSCDEMVLREIGSGSKKEYSACLLSMAVGKQTVTGSALAFSEGSVQERVIHVLRTKNVSQVIVAIAATLAVVLGLGFASNSDISFGSVDLAAVGPAVDTEAIDLVASAITSFNTVVEPDAVDPQSDDTDNMADTSATTDTIATAGASGFKTNDRGQTYGTFADAGGLNGNLPDLIAVQASNGKDGYITREDFIRSSRAASNPTEAAQFMEEYYQQSLQAFCNYYTRTTGQEPDYQKVDSVLREIRFELALNHSWNRLSEQQQVLVMELFPVGYRSPDFAQAAYGVASRAKWVSIPVYAVDGVTVVGEMIVQ